MIKEKRTKAAFGVILAMGLVVFSITACTGNDGVSEPEEIIQAGEVQGFDSDDDLDATLDGQASEDEALKEDGDSGETAESSAATSTTETDIETAFEKELAESEPELAENTGEVKNLIEEVIVDKDLSFDPGGMVVRFGFNSAELNQTGRDTLFNLAEQLKKDGNARIRISGHADERGSDEYNMDLSRSRSDSVKNELIELGVDPNRLTVVSYGESMPKDSRQSESAYSKNRRAEFSISL